MNNSIYLKALQLIKEDDWHQAHDLISEYDDENASRIHAFLHRIEGDLWNADYWYRRGGTTRPAMSISDEWEMLFKLMSRS